MTQPAPASPLATPLPWNLVADGYVVGNVPLFTRYAEDALRLAALAPGARVVDVAAGPGTLAFVAAGTAARVDAIDFSAQMIAHLEARLAREGVTNVFAQEGDGQALPYADASFDGGFSMFGLMFFPDRGRGFAELRRVLVPGGRAVVSSWQPVARVPLFVAMLDVLRSEMPMPPNDGKGPLVDRDDFAAEMRAAGFRDVAIHEAMHAEDWPSTAAGWAHMRRTFAPLVLLAHKMGAAFEPVAERMLARLEAAIGTGALHVDMPAWLGVGTK